MSGPGTVQRVIALDMEGVVTPEIWIAVAERTGVEALTRTTRDEPDYQKLMDYRIGILEEHGVPLSLIQDVIRGLGLLDGAKEFLDELRRQYVVVLLSDTFEQFADPFLELMGRPHLLCHRLTVENDRIIGFTPRIEEQKREAVHSFRRMNYHVTAMGDSHNDITMLLAADTACFFRPPDGLPAQYPELPVARTYAEALDWIAAAG